MPAKSKSSDQDGERFCPWCEMKYPVDTNRRIPLCPDCQAGLLEYDKEALVDLLGRVAGVNVIAMAALSLHAPDALETLGLWNAPARSGFSRRPVTMKEFARKHMKVQ
jgi:hypothetical protein